MIPKNITAILFDLDGTLIFRKPSSLDVFLQLIDGKGINLDEEKKRKLRQFIHYYWARSSESEADIKDYGKFTEAFWENYMFRQCRILGCSRAEAAAMAGGLQEQWEDAYQPEIMLAPQAQSTLTALREREYTLGLVSNRSLPFQEELNNLGLDKHFHFSFTAGEVNSWKPDRKIFHHALALAESKPEESIYIGDNYYADILGAKKWGLFPVLYDPADTFPEADCTVIQCLSDLV